MKDHLRTKEHHPYRVVLIHPGVGKKNTGGSLVVAVELAKRLNEFFEIELLCGEACGPWSHTLSCIPRSYAQRLMTYPILNPLLQRISARPDIVIEHLSSFFSSLIRLLQQPADLVFPHNDYGGLAVATCARWLTGTPVLFTEHNGLIANGLCLQRNLRFNPDHLVVFNEATVEFVRSTKPTQPLSLIPNGVDLDKFSPEGPSLSFQLKRPRVLCVGTLNRSNSKRIDLAIKAVAKLPEVSLVVCGNGKDKSYFQNLGNELLGPDRFTVQGVSFEQMPPVYRSADLFTLPSENEPFGLVYLEAMASGLPVVASNEASQKAIVTSGGLLCDVTNIDEYAATVRKALSIDWGDKPRQNASQFGWDEVTRQYRDLIVEMMVQRK